MKTDRSVPVAVALFCALTAGRAAASEGESVSPVEPLKIVAEPLAIKPGEPLSTRALVTHPPLIRGLLSWTIESRPHRGSMLR